MESFVMFLKEQEDFASLGAANASEISKAEQELNVKFAEEYADYVQACGAATFGSHEFTGICASKRLNVVDVTLKQRLMNPNLPLNLYVVEECGMDDVCIWQDEEGKVYEVMPGHAPQLIAPSLLAYCKD